MLVGPQGLVTYTGVGDILQFPGDHLKMVFMQNTGINRYLLQTVNFTLQATWAQWIYYCGTLTIKAQAGQGIYYNGAFANSVVLGATGGLYLFGAKGVGWYLST